MKRSASLLFSTCLIVFLAAGTACRRKGDRPNLLLITMDTTRADRLGCYGCDEAVTPTLDGFAASGVKFNRAYCNVPLTLPSHATILTGLYPPEHGCRVNGAHALDEEISTLAEVFKDHGYQTAAFVAAFVLDRKFGLDRGFETYDDYEVPTSEDIYDDNVMYRYRRGDKVTDAALSWLRRNYRKPFFCWVHYFDPHRPYYFKPSSSPEDLTAPYDAEVAFMDRQVGRLIYFMKEKNLLANTVIVAVGDHGEGLGEHGEEEHGLLLYDSSMRVPLLISRPGHMPESEEAAASVSTVDILPSILDLFGFKLPSRVSGRSFEAALEGKSIPDEAVYLETEFPLTEYGWSPLRGVVTTEWKYVLAPREELYDLKSDPGELDNLADAMPDRAKELAARLRALGDEMEKKEATEVKLDEISRRTLESLGYLGGGGNKKSKSASLRDPKDAIWMRREFVESVEVYQKGNITEAEEKLKQLIRESPESYTFRYKLAKILYEQKRFDDSRREFEEMVKMYPEEYKTHYNLGKTLRELGRPDEAIEEFRRALKFDPEQVEGYNNLGIVLLQLGRLEEAMKAFRSSISLDDEQVDPHNNLGNAFLSLGRTEKAMAEFRRAVEIDPDFFEGRYNLGLTLLRLGQRREAAEQFRESIRLRPDFAPARQKLRECGNVETR